MKKNPVKTDKVDKLTDKEPPTTQNSNTQGSKEEVGMGSRRPVQKFHFNIRQAPTPEQWQKIKEQEKEEEEEEKQSAQTPRK